MTSTDDLLNAGINAHGNGELAEAARLYQAVLKRDTGHLGAHTRLGLLLGQQQQWEPALAHLRTALRLNPQQAMAHCHLGQVLVASGATAEGLEHLEQAVTCDPFNVTAWDNLARIRILLGQYEAGEYAAMRALKIRPNEPHLLTRLGIAIAAQKRLAEALHCYQQALVLDRDHAEAWTQMGITFFLRNDPGSAEQALQTAISLNAEDTSALRHLALVSLRMGNHPGAAAHFERLLILTPDDEHSRLDLAVILLSSQQADLALQHLGAINSTLRESSKFRFYHGLALQQSGAHEQGDALLRELAKLQTDSYGEKARQLLHIH